MTRHPIEEYRARGKSPPVYRLRARTTFSPIDVNLQFILQEGWTQADRLRFHVETSANAPDHHPLAQLLADMKPHLLIRRYDREEDSFVAARIDLGGDIEILSNDRDFAQRYLHGLFLQCPPSFHSVEELEIAEEWTNDPETCSMFLGLVEGALGWDPTHQVPPAIEASLQEAEKALAIANYRSCVVMCRRSVEALLNFAFPRLIGRPPVDNKGRALTLNEMIEEFKKQQTPRIPVHLLHIVDSIRVVGNVPGAHPTEIKGYKFSKHDAEFALASVGYFLEQYFSKIDTEVSEYYTLTIDLTPES